MEGKNAVADHPDVQKILYVSWTIPPVQSGSAFITHQLLKNFKPEEYAAIGGGKFLYRCSKDYDGVMYHYCFTELNVKGHGDRFFFPLRVLLFPSFLLSMFRIAKRNKVQLVLATFPDAYYMTCAWMVSIFMQIPFYVYVHNTYVENRTGISRWIANVLQSQFFKRAVRIFVISEGMRALYHHNYPQWSSKLHVLPHSFSHFPETRTKDSEGRSGSTIKLVLIGTVNESNIDATRRVIQLVAKHAEKYQLDIYSSSNKQLLKLKYQLDLDLPGIRYFEAVPQEQVDHILQSYAACILTHGFTGAYSAVEYQTIFPTRTIPLLLSGKPILAHTPPGAFLTQFLEAHACAEIVTSKNEEDLLAALHRITADPVRKAELTGRQKTAAQMFYGPAICAQLRFMIDQDMEAWKRSLSAK